MEQKRSAIGNSELEKKKQIAREKYLDKIAPIEIDVFADGDDDVLDADYKPSPKKPKIVPSTENRKKSKKNSNPARKLTPMERIERLKRKSSKLLMTKQAHNTIASTGDPLVNVSTTSLPREIDSPINRSLMKKHPQIEPKEVVNHDEFFKEFDSDADKNRHEHIHQAPLLPKKNKDDSLNGEKDSEKGIRRDTASICSNEQQNVRTILEFFSGRFDYLHAEILALRKQLARIEAKSIQHTREPQSCQFDDGVFLDFEQSLAKEGLPIKSVNGVNELERKLTDPVYRKKLVKNR